MCFFFCLQRKRALRFFGVTIARFESVVHDGHLLRERSQGYWCVTCCRLQESTVSFRTFASPAQGVGG